MNNSSSNRLARALIKTVVFLLSLAPALWLFYAVYLAYTGGENLLGPEPDKFLERQTGDWSIRFLVLALALTPLRYIFNWPYLWQYRRMFGLFAFFYVCMHFLVFLMFTLRWQWADLGREIAEHPYITVGFAAFVLLIPLAATSLAYARRKLGRRWKQLHRTVYVINVLAIIHMYWLIRANYGEVLLYGSLVAFFLAYRLLRKYSTAVRRFSLLSP